MNRLENTDMNKLSGLLNRLRSTSKPTEKLGIMKEYDSDLFKNILKYTFDSFTMFNVKLKPSDIKSVGTYDLSEKQDEMNAVVRYCINSKSHKQNKTKVVELLNTLDEGSQELLIGMLNKNWKVGASDKAVDLLYPNLLRKFSVQLANKYERNHKPHKREQWIASYKLDGLRCVGLRFEDGWKMFSRTGKEFTTVDYIKPELEKIYEERGWTFFDGELYKHGLQFEDIQGPVMSSVNKQTVNVEYHVFVVGSAEGFLNQITPKEHVFVVNGREDEYKWIRFVRSYNLYEKDIELFLEEAFDNGYEGIMLRNPEYLYDYRRSNHLLKLKSKETDNTGEEISDCVVIGIEYNDSFPVIEDGEVNYRRLINRLIVEQENGVECKVGSGFTIDFRCKPEGDILGKKVEVQHQGFGNNGRMRFPRLKRVREDL